MERKVVIMNSNDLNGAIYGDSPNGLQVNLEKIRRREKDCFEYYD